MVLLRPADPADDVADQLRPVTVWVKGVAPQPTRENPREPIQLD